MSSASETGNLTMLISTTTTTTTAASTTAAAAAEVAVAASTISLTSTARAIVAVRPDTATATLLADAHSTTVILRDEWLWIYIGVCCVLGILLNVLVVWSLLRTKCNGTQYFLLQLSSCDIAALIVAPMELIYIQHQRWTFPPESCPIYLGLESFSSIATVYLLIALNLHAISTYNLARRTIRRDDKLARDQQQQNQQHLLSATGDEDTDGDYMPILAEAATPPSSDNVDDGYETPIDEQRRRDSMHQQRLAHQPCPRSLIIDYSQRKTNVAVILPVLFVWFVAASASTPLFALGSVLPNMRSPLICGVVNFDPQNNRLLQAMMLAVRVALPTVCVLLTGVAVAWTLRAARRRIRPCGLEEDVRQMLRMALVLTVTYVLASEQRVIGSMLFEVWSVRPLMLAKYPRFNGSIAMALAMGHWMMSAVRPLLYCAMDERVRLEVRRTLCCWPSRTKSARRKEEEGASRGQGKVGRSGIDGNRQMQAVRLL